MDLRVTLTKYILMQSNVLKHKDSVKVEWTLPRNIIIQVPGNKQPKRLSRYLVLAARIIDKYYAVKTLLFTIYICCSKMMSRFKLAIGSIKTRCHGYSK